MKNEQGLLTPSSNSIVNPQPLRPLYPLSTAQSSPRHSLQAQLAPQVSAVASQGFFKGTERAKKGCSEIVVFWLF